MFSELFHSIETETESRLSLLRCPLRRFLHASLGGAVVGLGAVGLLSLGARLVAVHPLLFTVILILAFALATAVKYFLGSRMFTTVTLMFPISVLRGTCTNREFACALIGALTGNLVGAALVGLVLSHAIGIGDATLLSLIVARKAGASAVTLFAQGLLCNWSLMLAAWALARLTRPGARWGLLSLSFLFFVCSGYEHSVVDAALLTVSKLAGAGPSWAECASTLLPVAAGNLLSGALVGLAGYFATHAPPQIPRLR